MKKIAFAGLSNSFCPHCLIRARFRTVLEQRARSREYSAEAGLGTKRCQAAATLCAFVRVQILRLRARAAYLDQRAKAWRSWKDMQHRCDDRDLRLCRAGHLSRNDDLTSEAPVGQAAPPTSRPPTHSSAHPPLLIFSWRCRRSGGHPGARPALSPPPASSSPSRTSSRTTTRSRRPSTRRSAGGRMCSS